MSVKVIIKKIIYSILNSIGKGHLLEYTSILKNEENTLSKIKLFYSGFITNNMKIIDVGANVGNYSKVFTDFGAQVIGLEPQDYCQKILNKRFSNNKLFQLLPLACGSKESISSIRIASSHTIASMNPNWIEKVKSSNRFSNEKWVKEKKIHVTTLDKIIKNNFCPDYLKIDVEGYETEVLKGLHTPIKYISFEITLPEMKQNALECVNEINRLGKYQFLMPSNEKLIAHNIWHNSDEIVNKIELLTLSKEYISTDIFCKKL